MRSLSTVLLATALAALTAVAGCGGSGDDAPTASVTITGTSTSTAPSPTAPRTAPTTPSSPAKPQDPRLPPELRLPSSVPTESEGIQTDAVSARVIRKWSGALTGGDIERAARFFALGSKVQNGTQVITLDTEEKRVVFNVTFPCGADPTKLEKAASGYTIVDFVLTDRKGGDCSGGVGGTARCAIRVRDGHITDWYRVPESRGTPQPGPRDRGPELDEPQGNIA